MKDIYFNGKFWGTIKEDGRIYNGTTYKGRIERSGDSAWIKNTVNNNIGRIDLKSGRITNTNLETMGFIEKNGRITDKNLKVIGNIKGGFGAEGLSELIPDVSGGFWLTESLGGGLVIFLIMFAIAVGLDVLFAGKLLLISPFSSILIPLSIIGSIVNKRKRFITDTVLFILLTFVYLFIMDGKMPSIYTLLVTLVLGVILVPIMYGLSSIIAKIIGDKSDSTKFIMVLIVGIITAGLLWFYATNNMLYYEHSSAREGSMDFPSIFDNKNPYSDNKENNDKAESIDIEYQNIKSSIEDESVPLKYGYENMCFYANSYSVLCQFDNVLWEYNGVSYEIKESLYDFGEIVLIKLLDKDTEEITYCYIKDDCVFRTVKESEGYYDLDSADVDSYYDLVYLTVEETKNTSDQITDGKVSEINDLYNKIENSQLLSYSFPYYDDAMGYTDGEDRYDRKVKIVNNAFSTESNPTEHLGIVWCYGEVDEEKPVLVYEEIDGEGYWYYFDYNTENCIRILDESGNEIEFDEGKIKYGNSSIGDEIYEEAKDFL